MLKIKTSMLYNRDMKLLMHMCCSNCSLYPLKSLLSKGIDVKGLWFNPNIHPEEEYNRRLDSLGRLKDLWALDIEFIDHYGKDEFMRKNRNDEKRCIRCYSMRLEETAIIAKKMGLDGFTTTLLVSPYQKFDFIVSIGMELQRIYAIPFFVEDFRVGYRQNIGLSKELGLYRQKYCGCLYSLEEAEKRKGKIKGVSQKSQDLLIR